MLDLQKAFDNVDQNIFCNKLEGMGVVSIDWFKSYLANRQQVVNIKTRLCKMWCSSREYIWVITLFMLCKLYVHQSLF